MLSYCEEAVALRFWGLRFSRACQTFNTFNKTLGGRTDPECTGWSQYWWYSRKGRRRSWSGRSCETTWKPKPTWWSPRSEVFSSIWNISFFSEIFFCFSNIFSRTAAPGGCRSRAGNPVRPPFSPPPGPEFNSPEIRDFYKMSPYRTYLGLQLFWGLILMVMVQGCVSVELCPQEDGSGETQPDEAWEEGELQHLRIFRDRKYFRWAALWQPGSARQVMKYIF